MPCMGYNFQVDTDEDFLELFNKNLEDLSHLATSWVDSLAEEIARSNFKIVGVTTGHQQTNAAVGLINHIKKYNPSIVTCIGGSACDGDMANGIMSLSENIDYIFSGESEISWGEFLDQYKLGYLPEKGILQGEHLSNLDSIQFHEKSYKDYAKQLEYIHGNTDNLSLLYETSRGCWWAEKNKCTFCGVNGCDKHYRSKSESKIISDIEMLINSHKNIKHIQMVDTLMPRKFSSSLLPEFKNLLGKTTLFYEQRADLKLKEVIDLKLSRVKYTQVGIEALSTDILKLMNKGIDAGQNIKFLRWAKSVGMIIGWNLLSEIPNDKKHHWESALKIVPYIHHLNPPLQIRPVEIVRFSPYYESPEKYAISSLNPNKIYSEVFPEYAATWNLAWMFNADYESASKEDLILKKRIATVFGAWIDKWRISVSKIPQLNITKKDGLFFLEDSRFDKYVKTQISYEKAFIALMGVSEGNKNAELEWGIENNVVYLLDGNYIPLATANPNLLEEFFYDKS